MIDILIRFVISAIAFFAADLVVPGIRFEGPNILLAYIVVPLVFGLVNAILKPIVAIFTCFIMIITLGLFTFVINAIMLLVTAWAAQQLGFGFYVDGFISALFGSIIISLVSTILAMVQRNNKH